MSYLVALVSFFLLYFVLPNTKVKPRAALWGAALASLIWSVAKFGFGMYINELIPYSKVYGVVGLIPLTVFWVFVTWVIVLFGLQVTFTTQHLKTLDLAQIDEARRRRDHFIANDITVINIVREIAQAFQKNNAPVESEHIRAKLNLPGELADQLFNVLIQNGIIARTSDPKVGFVPVTDPCNIKLSQISQTVADSAFAQNLIDQPQVIDEIAKQQIDSLNSYTLAQTLTPKSKPKEQYDDDNIDMTNDNA